MALIVLSSCVAGFRQTRGEDVADGTVAEQLAIIARVGPQGAGSGAARRARNELAGRGVEVLPRLLAAMDTPNVIAANWYRTIFEEIVGRGLARKETEWPTPYLKEYVGDIRRL